METKTSPDSSKGFDAGVVPYGRQTSKIELLKAQVSRDSVEAEGRWRPFRDVRFFIFVFMVIAMSMIATFTTFTAAMRTIERRFGLSSTQTGLLASMNDIVNISLVLFLGYLGERTNKPRVLAVLTFLGGLGVLIYAVPHFAFPAREMAPSVGGNNTGLGRGMLTCRADSECTAGGENLNSNEDKAYIVFLVAAALSGLGNSGLGILSVSYIDENTPKLLSPFYIGIASSAYPLGPVLGFGLAAVFLRLPENLKRSPVSSSDPSFIGCWWMPFLIYGSLLIVFSVPLLFFPKHMPHYNKVKVEQMQKTIEEKGVDFYDLNSDEKKSTKERVKDIIHSFTRVLTNAPYMMMALSSTCAIFMIVSLFTQMTKYLQIQFSVSPTKASLIVGGSGAATQVAGILIAGFVLKRFKVNLKGASRIYFVCFILIVILLGFMFPWKCTTASLPPNREDGFVTSCNADCACSMDSTQHACGDDMVLFPSPCIAGCNTGYPNQTYTDCRCSTSSTPLQIGFCKVQECQEYIYYILIFALMNFTASFARLSGQILQLRTVDQNLRSVALATASFLYNGLVFIPGPILMGGLFDSACLLWRTTCGNKGNCLVYDMDLFRDYMHGISLGVVAPGCVLAAVLVYLIARKLRQEENAKDASTGVTGFTNVAIFDALSNEDAASLRSYNTRF